MLKLEISVDFLKYFFSYSDLNFLSYLFMEFFSSFGKIVSLFEVTDESLSVNYVDFLRGNKSPIYVILD